MTAIATLNPQVLRQTAQQGAANKAKEENSEEEGYRFMIYTDAKKLHKEGLTLHTKNIMQAAQEGRTSYLIPIFDMEWEEDHWKHPLVRKDGTFCYRIYSADRVTPGKASTLFESGVVHHYDKLRDFDPYEWYRLRSWMTARKLALTFLQQKLTVQLLKIELSITSEYQKHVGFKSGHVDMWVLKISWD